MASISLEELHAYHSIDREVFSRLVITLVRDPAESLLVMATWLWLEEKGFPNIIGKMMNLSDPLVNVLADEAVSCLNSLESNNPPLAGNVGLPFTSRLMEKEISLQLFLQNRFTAISGIKNFLNTVCARIFTDILQHVFRTTTQVIPNQPLVIPGFPHRIFGGLTIMPRPMDFDFPTGGLWGWSSRNNISEDDRTMFLTFSRGFPVTGDEVRELFTRMYGDCVETVHMQENVASEEQPLFARLVLNSVATVDQILNGRRIAKFRINGKHIWARKYERRE
ncbi:Rho guanine nucleotide exchange factor [Melia azedarach]|uniref:Rho guanine nucleotide exchange factor n=1 Tax=Melia azedarach TaxID=155640 RepID=A0ACC1X903_MELAZ|nr:Rho guanine nucleotide exchange factor [Melia azedarach]